MKGPDVLANGEQHSNRRACAAVSAILVLLLTCFPLLASRQEKTPQPLKQDEAYLRMLQQADAVKSVPHEAPAEKHSERLPSADSQKEKP